MRLCYYCNILDYDSRLISNNTGAFCHPKCWVDLATDLYNKAMANFKENKENRDDSI